MAYSGSPKALWLQLWGKTTRDTLGRRYLDRRYHPLLFHMLDTAAVAGLVWDQWFFPRLRNRLECTFETNARIQTMFLAGAHDLGKASPGFQKRVPELSRNLGLPFSAYDQERPHGFISTRVLQDTLCSSPTSAFLAQTVGGHHGVFPRTEQLSMGRDTLGNKDWDAARQGLLKELAGIVGFDLDQISQFPKKNMDPAIIPILAGFFSVVDWISSNQDFFPCVAEYGAPVQIGAADYWTKAQKQAKEALEALGWLPAVTFSDEAEFTGIFPAITPNTMQDAVVRIAVEQTSPYLMIIEAPMGNGKTEAALFAADMAMCRSFARGMYIAMPTQATSNAMFHRVLNDYLKQRGHHGKLNLQLVHGDALLAQMPDVKEGEVLDFKPRDIGDNGDVEAQSWFTSRKRPLLAPFGVGTIDQSLLSVLKTRHWFVRLFGLAGKVVIFDEVHAYDAYMSTILERLLQWLAEVDCTVILLSATLPDAKLRALVRAYSGQTERGYERYPRISVAKPHHLLDTETRCYPSCTKISLEETHTISVRFAPTDLQTLAASLSQQLEQGGCAAVICNTVNRSIETYKYLRHSLKDTECLLFHARTLQMWRRERETEVLTKFGKGVKQPDGAFRNAGRPARAVLVATQVIEQSLDLDFDLMVSEMAPIDLLLQRCGRLHRHLRHRPAGVETPRLIVLCDQDAAGSPPKSFGRSEYVYDRYILLRTWIAMRQREKLEIPTEIESLVEAVYGESPQDCSDSWTAAMDEAKKRMEDNHNGSVIAAKRLLVGLPRNSANLIEDFNDQLVENDDPTVHEAAKAETREGDPSITAVLLPEGTNLAADPDILNVRTLLDRSAKLSHPGIFRWLRDNGATPRPWAGNAHLRYARLLHLDGQNQVRVGEYMMTVDQKLGIVIEKEEREDECIQSS